MKKVVAYYRTSTDEQRMGVAAQKDIVQKYCNDNCIEIICVFEEHESGKKNDRPQLLAALQETEKNSAYLIVAKIDRLTRVAYFGLQLCEKYKIIFCDHPEMSTLEQCIYFGMAQQEREYISQRTKDALAELKKKGVKLGAPNATFTSEMREKGLKKRRENSLSNDCNRKAYAVVSVMQGNYSDKARFLNANGFLTAKGKYWSPWQVQRLISMFSSVSAK